ncbi:phosphoribosylamine--glycine ligase [Vibrio tritonius]|uniref:phosphoribosylamine--glycine ligase n=1 Tax=Vibrio tritonius TaxID=1435069 RepID=UPI0009EBCCA2
MVYSLNFSLEKGRFSVYFSHAKRLRELLCNKLVRIRAIKIRHKVLAKHNLLFSKFRLS